MNRPIQFITIDKEGVCGLTKEAEEIILGIKENIAVICVAGLYRTGKSYLLNRLLGRQDGFEIGPTTNSCTKGLWMWGEPIYLEDKNLQAILIDTEGLGSAFEDRNETIDMEIFCLGVLLSSLFIYNSMKNIDENAVESLALVINFAKKIQSSYKNVDNYANNFPSFLWVLRDFALELIDGSGKRITPNQYLENALNAIEFDGNQSIDEETMKKNEIRKLLKVFFKERDCYTLIRPVSDEKKLRNIDKLPKNELRGEFLQQMDDLVQRIFLSVRPKQVQGSYLNGKMYLDLVKMYINSLNNNSIPDVKTSWKIVIDQQMEKVFEKSFNFYVEEMLSIDYKKLNSVDELLKYHNEYKSIAMDYLREFSNVNVPLVVFLDLIKRLEDKINDQLNEFISRWNDLSIKQCKAITEQIIKEYSENNDTTDVFTCLELVEDVFKFIDDSVPNVKKYEQIYPEILEFFVKILKTGFRESKNKYESEVSELKHEKTVIQGIIDKTKDIMVRTKEEYEDQIRELKDQLLTSRLDLEAKIDEKAKLLKNAEYSHESTVEELRSKIVVLNTLLENKKQTDKEVKKSKKAQEDGVLELKIDNVLDKIDSFKDVFVRNELDKAKLQLKLEINSKIEDVEDEFNKKLGMAKKICEKTVFKLKTSYQEEITNLKQLIKELYDEINDFKCQVSSQEYKIELYKEKIITYEKEKKSQTDHAELLRVLTQKLNSFIETLGKIK